MITKRIGPGSLRITLFGLIFGVATVIIYWFATQGPDAWITWNLFTMVVLGGISIAIGAAIGSGAALASWTTWDSILAAVLAGVVGVIFWLWGLGWNLLEILKAVPGYGMALRDLFYGMWFLAAILVPYIIRRPGAAVAPEVIAAIVSALLGAQWGLTVLISGLVQGGLAEIVFSLGGYRRFGLGMLILAAGGAALGSLIVDYVFWYSTLAPHILILMLLARLISAAFFSGLLAKGLGDALVAAGVLNNTALGRERLALQK